jgi:hypothetical protein
VQGFQRFPVLLLAFYQGLIFMKNNPRTPFRLPQQALIIDA